MHAVVEVRLHLCRIEWDYHSGKRGKALLIQFRDLWVIRDWESCKEEKIWFRASGKNQIHVYICTSGSKQPSLPELLMMSTLHHGLHCPGIQGAEDFCLLVKVWALPASLRSLGSPVNPFLLFPV